MFDMLTFKNICNDLFKFCRFDDEILHFDRNERQAATLIKYT